MGAASSAPPGAAVGSDGAAYGYAAASGARRNQLYDSLVNLMIIGEQGVGKSSLLNGYFDGCVKPYDSMPVGIDDRHKIIDWERKKVTLKVAKVGRGHTVAKAARAAPRLLARQGFVHSEAKKR
eukprot:NODE_4950_length_626_cov_510.810858.p2 GENE.NODE_4950_length_626_cov_510.810858~~NODE_4950_length_626_cov_510.810858.p2  ORF type:complete len:124 (+),score=25.79 NODE_4950_length_626_cov_510.810858:3-374(+)